MPPATTQRLDKTPTPFDIVNTVQVADLSQVNESLKRLAESPLENVKLDRNKIQSAAAEVLRPRI